MFDIFYRGPKPNLFAHEREADSIKHAQQLSRTRYFWWVNYLADYTDWNWLYEPVPWQAEYTHTWPSAWDQVPGACLVPRRGNPDQLLTHNQSVPALHDPQRFEVLSPCEFDFDWLPHPWDPPYIYVFGNQHWDSTAMPTVTYTVPGATEKKYMAWPLAQLLPDQTNWQQLEAIDQQAWDWSWRPDPGDPPYIYVFGNQWNPSEFKASVEYHVPGATERKYMDRRTVRLPQKHLFTNKIAVGEFDYSWEPNPFDPPYIYVFGNTWYSAEIEPSVEYHVPGATERKYVSDIVARPWGVMADYEFLHDIELDKFDWTWHPNPMDPPYIYVFGNQWHTAEIMPTLKYHQPGATELKYMDHPRATLPENPNRPWYNVVESDMDYSWVPDPGDPPYIYVFGNQWWPAEKMPTIEYRMPGATERKYVDYPRAQLLSDCKYWTSLTDHRYTFDYSWQPDPGDPPYRYVFGNQWHSAEIMPTVSWLHPESTEETPTKYLDWPRAELEPDSTLWTLPAGVTPDSVDFSWVPDPGEPPYIYQFATQHQKTGGPVYTVPGATEVKYLEHVEIKIEAETVPIIEIDHLDGNAGQIANTVKRVRYFDNYRDTLIRIAKSLQGEHEHVWICSSVCDYTDFDFTWHPEKWQSTMLHVFASDEQKFGDTFYMHVPTFAERAEKKALLEWYSVNYVARRSVLRRPLPQIVHSQDSHVDAVKAHDFVGPLAVFTNERCDVVPAVSLWREETKTIVPLGSGASHVVVPKTAVPYIKTQLYDYAHIDKSHRHRVQEESLDIVFISNGESNAEANYQHLLKSIPSGQHFVHRVRNVNGRVAAYQAAAQASTTPWFFAVFAKLEVNSNFAWNWQPDRMQQPKHYIFHALNPVNKLVYGHQAMIAYNKHLVMCNAGQGLDFTLDQSHEVVPLLSGTARYADDPWMAWRTAFRECLKLRASLPDVENEYRLSQWMNSVGSTTISHWSQQGAADAWEYYDEVAGDFVEIKKSYDWDWLVSYLQHKHNLTPGQLCILLQDR